MPTVGIVTFAPRAVIFFPEPHTLQYGYPGLDDVVGGVVVVATGALVTPGSAQPQSPTADEASREHMLNGMYPS